MIGLQLAEVSSASGESEGDGLSEDEVIAKLTNTTRLSWCPTYWDIFNDLKRKFTNDRELKDEIKVIKRRIKGFCDANYDSSYIQDIFIETALSIGFIIILNKKAPNGRLKTLEHICREVVKSSAPDEAKDLIKDRIHIHIASAVIVDD